jgi:hypothetical protein
MKKCRKKQKKCVHMECHIFYYHVISVTNMIIAIYFGNLEKARSNTMPKAILELEMPEGCRGGCPFYKVCDICDILSSWNHHMPVYTPSKGRRKDCPLKLVEGKEGEP